ncbi:NADPH-dependent FMN reductase [Ideonella sp. YS5]|uniref:NADPH-dependent FMN reductase n=1 Tax=Ideonella sp. YS5 TaxID=3453714 RepID=UPI003EE8CE33
MPDSLPALDAPAFRIAALAGSPSARSRSTALLREALLALRPAGVPQAEISLRDLPAAAMLHGDAQDPAVARALAQVRAAELVLIATPIYKAAYSGVLKLFIDLLPPDALRGKRVLPLATGGSVAHLLAVDYALRPVLATLGAREILDTVYATDAQFETDQHGAWRVDAAVRERVRRALSNSLDAAASAPPPRRPALVDRSGAATAAC